MKTNRYCVRVWVLAIAALSLAILSSSAQTTNIVVYNFDTADQVNGTAAPYTDAWGNWYGTAYYQLLWSTDDASNNPNSGSMEVMNYFPDSGIGGCCGPQFVAYDQNNGVQDVLGAPLNGNGTAVTNYVVTNITFDIKFDPSSTDTNANGTYRNISVFTRGTAYNQNSFGTISGIYTTNTNWIHMSFPVGPNANWATIPNVGFSHWSDTETGTFNFFIDNIAFQEGTVSFPPPVVSMQKASPGLRIFAEGGQYSRTYLATVDTGQSWVGGAYPVSYSFTVSGVDPSSPINECHAYWLPLNTAATPLNEYSDYGSPDAMNLYIHAGAPGYLDADLAWKTNSPNANPNNFLVSVTNATMVGTWTVTFTSATDGTLTAPGAGTVAFTNTIPADVANIFANPVVWMFGLQPDVTEAIGQYIDVTHAQSVGVASPGVPVNADFTTGNIDTNVWLTSSVSAANGLGLAPVAPDAPWWVFWTTPDIGFTLATKADLGNTNIAWKTLNYYAGYPTNGPTLTTALDFGGAYKWTLVPSADLPTVDGTSNGVKSATGYFLMQKPAPAQ